MKVGFIGLGIMGKPMCRNLMKAGYEAVVYNRSKASVEELAAEGAQAAGSPAEVAENCQVIITMLPNSPQVREVCLGENGIASAAKEGTIVIDMSSIDPVQSKEIGAELNKKGIDLMDAPVSGGEPKAIDGTISVMVGGSKENFDKYYDLLMAMAGSVVYVGELGSGNVAKLANQVIVALNIAAVSEALTLAVKNDADPELVYKAIRGGLAGSTVLDAKAPMMMDRNFKPGFRIELHIKDLNNALNAGHAVNAALPLTSQVMEIMQSLKADGNEKDDHSAIVKYYEKISDTSVEKNQNDAGAGDRNSDNDRPGYEDEGTYIYCIIARSIDHRLDRGHAGRRYHKCSRRNDSRSYDRYQRRIWKHIEKYRYHNRTWSYDGWNPGSFRSSRTACIYFHPCNW